MDFKKILFQTNTIDVEKALPDGVVYCNKDGRIQWVNDKAAELFETSKMHLMTSNITDFIENALNLILNSVMYDKAVIAKLVSSEIYFDMTTKEIDGGYVLDFRDIAGSPTSSSGVLRNTSDSSESAKDKNAFLVKIANDFKSPLQSIIGFSQAIADGLGGNISEQQEKYIRIINKNSSELMYFMDKLIELSRTEMETSGAEYKTFDIVNLINSVIKFNEQLYKDKSINSKVELSENVKSVVVSDDKIMRNILQNIFEVIIKSVDMTDVIITISKPEQELLQSKLVPDDTAIMISVAAGSMLLSESDLESMFDPYKIVETSNRKNLVRAITLASTKNLVTSLNGAIWVESKILKNTCFNMIIPQKRI